MAMAVSARFQKDPSAVVRSGPVYSDLWFDGKLLLQTAMAEGDVSNILYNCPSTCYYKQHKADAIPRVEQDQSGIQMSYYFYLHF